MSENLQYRTPSWSWTLKLCCDLTCLSPSLSEGSKERHFKEFPAAVSEHMEIQYSGTMRFLRIFYKIRIIQLLLENFEDHCSRLRNINLGHMPENLGNVTHYRLLHVSCKEVFLEGSLKIKGQSLKVLYKFSKMQSILTFNHTQ